MEFSGARLRNRRKHLRLSQAELGEMVGLSQRSISDLETGASLETTKLLELARACGVSPDWLLGKDVPMEPGGVKPSLKSGPGIILMEEPENYLHIGKMFGGQVVREFDVKAGAAPTGGIVDEFEADGSVSRDKVIANWGLPPSFVERELGARLLEVSIIRIRGDSMDDGTARGLISGDRVIIDHADVDVRQGGIFAVFDGEGVIVKQVELLRGQDPPAIVCKSRNTAYAPITLTLELPVRVVGRVAGRISRM